MEDPNAEAEGGLGSGVVSDAKVVESPSISTDDPKDEKVDKIAGMDDDDEEFDFVSHSMYSLVPRGLRWNQIDACTNYILFTVFFIGAGKVSRPRVDLYGTWIAGPCLLQPPRKRYWYQCTLGARNLEHGGKFASCFTLFLSRNMDQTLLARHHTVFGSSFALNGLDTPQKESKVTYVYVRSPFLLLTYSFPIDRTLKARTAPLSIGVAKSPSTSPGSLSVVELSSSSLSSSSELSSAT